MDSYPLRGQMFHLQTEHETARLLQRPLGKGGELKMLDATAGTRRRPSWTKIFQRSVATQHSLNEQPLQVIPFKEPDDIPPFPPPPLQRILLLCQLCLYRGPMTIMEPRQLTIHNIQARNIWIHRRSTTKRQKAYFLNSH